MTGLVTKYLPLVAGAPDGIKKLRGLILELAVRGKLVEQDSADESAKVLLNRIADRRVQTSRATKASSPMTAEDSPYPLPLGWTWTRLATQVLESGAGWSPSCEARPREGNEWGVLKVSAVSWGDFSPEENKALPANLEPRPEHVVSAGDFLVSRANTAELVARSVVVNATPPRLMLSDKIVRLKLTAECSARYINLVNTCPDARRYYGSVAGGTSSSMKNVTREQILHLPLPLPPLAEQHRIVAKVDELMALCDRLEAGQTDAEAAHAQLVQALLGSLTLATDAADFRASWQSLSAHFHTLFTTEASMDALKQTVLQLAVMGRLVPQDESDEAAAAFLQRMDEARTKQQALVKRRVQTDDVMAEPSYNPPECWSWRSLGSVLNITGGVTLGRKLGDRDVVTKPYLRVANVQRGHLALDQIKEVDVPEDEVDKYRLLMNDLLITEGGDWDKVGCTAIWRGEIADCLHQNHVFRARPWASEFNCAWAELFLNSAPARNYFAGSSKQTTNLASINMTQLRACAFPVPPLAEQHRIVAKVNELMALCDQLKAQLAEARQQHGQLATVLTAHALA